MKLLPRVVVISIVSLYFFLRVYSGHNAFLMSLNTFLKNFDLFVGPFLVTLLGFMYSLRLKQLELIPQSKNSVLYCYLVLYRQHSTLKNVYDMANEAVVDGYFECKKMLVSKLSIHIDQGNLTKIILNPKIAHNFKVLENLQCLLAAEDTFNQCLNIVDSHNLLVNELLLKDGMQNKNMVNEAMETLKNLKSYSDYCLQLNEGAMNNLTSLSKECFKKFVVPKSFDIVPMGEIKV
ncbi:MAG: hypothetical protein Q7V63_09405 [Gammaproteobacteria bacterium]|nr:hypothetical protein [Gammaproteobacteria bacterium]